MFSYNQQRNLKLPRAVIAIISSIINRINWMISLTIVCLVMTKLFHTTHGILLHLLVTLSRYNKDWAADGYLCSLFIIAQVFRLSAVHCQMTRYSQRVPVLCVSQWNLFWQKYQPIRLFFLNQVRPGKEWFPSPLGDFNRLFEDLIG